ncbi:hypothetical protein BS17DRAFT_763776 [Gyrodon lividus]|nr:hypothetical protein BS17DRAFT_763776 [Gyrodon lividus]
MGAKEANHSDPAVGTTIIWTKTHVQLARSHTEKPILCNTKLKDHIRRKCTEMEKALEMMKQAWESWQKITERITHLTKQSERRQKQMVQLSLLEASLDLLQKDNTILHGRLHRQEELMAAQEQDLQDLVVKIVDKRGGAMPLIFSQANMLLS